MIMNNADVRWYLIVIIRFGGWMFMWIRYVGDVYVLVVVPLIFNERGQHCEYFMSSTTHTHTLLTNLNLGCETATTIIQTTI